LIAKTLCAGGHSNNPLDENLIAHALRGEGHDASEDGTGRGTPIVVFGGNRTSGALEVAPALNAKVRSDFESEAMIAFDCKASGRNGFGTGDVAPTLRAMGHSNSHQNAGGQVAVSHLAGVRRITPTEAERLQGFPDDWTKIPWRGRPTEDCPDGPRYKAVGNSMAVPVIRWLGERIQLVDRIVQEC
jgi:DNA (cytosine-5)-methyltransferase 1